MSSHADFRQGANVRGGKCPAPKFTVTKARFILIQISFHYICLAKRTLKKTESRRLVGTGRYINDNRRIYVNMHVLLHILEY